MNFELQKLKIPEGWLIEYNQFYDVFPSEETVNSVDTVFNEDILQFTHKSRNRLIDLGWYPEGDFSRGAFGLVVYEGDFNGTLLYNLRTRSKEEVVSVINRLLGEITEGHL